MATCSADRAVKLYDATTQGRPVASLSHGDAVAALAFSAKSDLLATACADKKVRVWPVKTGSIDNPLRSQDEGEAVNAVAFSPDGSSFLWGAANHKVKEWNNEVAAQKRELTEPTDWVYAVAISPDGKTLVAGAGDGKVYFWNEADGKLVRSLVMGPGTTTVAAGVKR
jgi:WD40 repeat protein